MIFIGTFPAPWPGSVRRYTSITEQLIDHRSQLSGVAAIYNRYDYLKEVREALEMYEAHVFGVVVQ